jgi:Pao retrotransposon peptidase
VAIMADIESMFYQVSVPESQRSFLRFVWWPDGNTDVQLEDYQMTVHLFGATSSPSCANFALRATAKDNEDKFGKMAADTLRKNFYVDDMLKSVRTSAEAIRLIKDIHQMCAAGGFRLTKYVTNCREVFETIPASDRSQNAVNISLSQSAPSIERALGVCWCVENDTLGFRIILKDKPQTRRGILSTISSIFDPLGLAAPFLLKCKKLLQRLCNSKRDWDDEIDGDDRACWEQWRSNLPSLESIEVERCFKPADFSNVISVELHHFSNASLVGYGQCSYLRVTNADGQIHCSLVIGKSRVTPTKPVTIPRLELTAATTSA